MRKSNQTVRITPRQTRMWLCVNSRKGQKPIEVEILMLFENRARIRALDQTPLGGRYKVLEKGQEALVPLWTIKDRPVEYNEAPTIQTTPRVNPPLKHYRVMVATTRGNRTRYYRGRHPGVSREQAGKVGDVISVLHTEEITEQEFVAGKKNQ